MAGGLRQAQVIEDGRRDYGDTVCTLAEADLPLGKVFHDTRRRVQPKGRPASQDYRMHLVDQIHRVQ